MASETWAGRVTYQNGTYDDYHYQYQWTKTWQGQGTGGTPRAERWACWCLDEPGSSAMTPTTPFVPRGWWTRTGGESGGTSSGTSWGGPWGDSYDQTANDPGFYEGAYYGRDNGGGPEEYFAYLGDAFYDPSGPCSGSMFWFAYAAAQSLRGQGQGGTGTAVQRTSGSGSDISRSVQVADPSGVAGPRLATSDDRNEQNGESAILQSQAATTGGAVEIGRYPSSGGTYIVTRSSFALPDGRVALLYHIWFQKDMLWFLALPAWKELRKQVMVTVSPGELLEAQARYDRLVCSLAEGLADAHVRSDFADALEQTREAAKQELRDLATGYVVGKVQKLRRAGRVLHFADDAGRIGSDIAKAVNHFEKRLSLREQVKVYKHLYDTYKKHVEKYGKRASSSEEVDRIRRELEAYRRILEERGRTFGPSGELIE